MDRHQFSPRAGRKIRESFLRKLTANAGRPNALSINGTLLPGVFTDSFTLLANYAPPQQRLEVVRLKRDLLPQFSTELDESSASSASSGAATPGGNGVIQKFDETTRSWEDSTDEVTVADVYGLPYERGSLQVVYLNAEREVYLIIPQTTVRTARTVADVDGSYPADPDAEGASTAGERPRVYAIQFVTVSFPLRAGAGDLTVEPLDPSVEQENSSIDHAADTTTPPHAYAYNLSPCYIPEGEPVWAYWQDGRWFTQTIKGLSERLLEIVGITCGPLGMELDEEYRYYEDGVLVKREDANPDDTDVAPPEA